LAPEEPVYLRSQAELLSEQLDHAGALKSAHAAVHHGPERAASWVTLGFVASNSGDKALARSAYEKALVLDPEEASAWNNLGCLDLADGKARRARERFREALRLQPEGKRAQKNLDQTLTGQTLEGFVAFDDVVRALAEEIAAAGRTRVLLALAMEADAARAALRAALTQSGTIRAQAALGAFGVGLAWGFISASPMPRLIGAGAGLLASAGARRWLDEERRRVRARLDEDRAGFAQLRRDWLEGKLERAARDIAARRIVERAALLLCREEIPAMDPNEEKP
jgi:tetratricopeptide (TPR) repeat protein